MLGRVLRLEAEGWWPVSLPLGCRVVWGRPLNSSELIFSTSRVVITGKALAQSSFSRHVDLNLLERPWVA